MGHSSVLLALGALWGGALIGPPSVAAAAAHAGVSSSRSMECFEYGYDYYGYDMQEVPSVVSPSACMEECLQNKGCGFWSYNTFTRTCYLKSLGAILERRSSPGIVSGPRQCGFSSSCLEVGVDLYGYDIEAIEGRYIMNPLDCQRLCEGNPQCAFFSWKYSTHACYLKSAPAILNRREDPDVTSGPRSCVGSGVSPPSANDYPAPFDPSTAPPSCVLAGVDYRGNNIKTAKARSSAACQMLCLKQRDCEYWTWSSHTHICSLKNAEAPNGRTEGRHTLDKVSGSKRCTPVLPGCHFVGVGVVGAALSKQTAASFDICQIHCASFSGCTHFSYDLNTGDCTLWSSFNTYSKGITTEGLVSGQAFCDADKVCFEQSDYVGHNIEENETGEVSSPGVCQTLCQKNSDCYYWTWLQSNKGCYLKDANALQGRTNDATALGRFSGPKYCNISYGCISVNSIYTGMPLQTTEADDFLSCSAKCASNPFCTAWTYHGDMRLCALTSGDPSLSPKPIRGAVSARRNCFTQDEEEQSCFDEGIQYSLDDVHKISTAGSAFECYLQCQKEEYCMRWTLKGGDTCFLMKSSSGSVVYDPSSVSGPRMCEETTPLSGSASITGSPIRASSVYSPQGCANQCLHNLECRYWSYIPGEETNCLLFNIIDGYTGKDHISGFVPRVMLASSCSYPEETVVGTVSLTSVDECAYECASNRLCRAWSAVVEETTATKPPQQQVSSSSSSSSSTTATDPEVLCQLHADDSSPSFSWAPQSFCGTALNPKTLRVGKIYSIVDGDKVFSRSRPISECPSLCAAEPDCMGWHYVVGEGCVGAPSIDIEEEHPSGVSAPMDRPVPALRFNVSFPSGDIITPPVSSRVSARSSPFRSLRSQAAGLHISSSYPSASTWMAATTYNDCITACATEAACLAWTYKDNACILYANTDKAVYDPNAISGTRSIEPLPWEFLLGHKYRGDPVASYPAAEPPTAAAAAAGAAKKGDNLETDPTTPMECAARAAANQCWSFNTATHNCLIFEQCEETDEAEEFVSGYIPSNEDTAGDASPPLRPGDTTDPGSLEEVRRTADNAQQE